MKNNFNLLLCFALIPSFVNSAYGQFGTNDRDTLSINDVRVGVNSMGDIGWDLQGNLLFEIPKNSGQHTVFASNLWFGGLDEAGQLRNAAQTYRIKGTDYGPGPGNVAPFPIDSVFFERFNQVFTLTSAEIANHRANFAQPGYTMPPDLANWPAHGDTSNGESAFLAPYVDVNNDGWYTPMMGDYPRILGDQASYTIYFNHFALPTETGNTDITRCEIHTMTYAYDRPASDPLSQVVFVQQWIKNRGNLLFEDFLVSQWVDFHLGNPSDDYYGCDTTRNLFFAYNADNFDDTTGSFIGYGTAPPAMGVVFLNQELGTFMTIGGDSSVTGFPENAVNYYNYQRGFWIDGNPITLGGNGYAGLQRTAHQFSGDPTDTAQWSMLSANLAPGGRSSLGSSRKFRFDGGESICLSMAFVFARGTDHLHSVEILKQRVDAVQVFYESTGSVCEFTGVPTQLSAEELLGELSIYPNPAAEWLRVSFSTKESGEVILLEVTGRQVLTKPFLNSKEIQISVSDLPVGMYVVQVNTLKGGHSKKVMIQR
ncbi:MAG: T9SS type A sorting domain-containing protein [Bacteroidota bacterium]